MLYSTVSADCLSAGCRSSTSEARIIWDLLGDVHSSWFTRSTRRTVCIDPVVVPEDAPRSSIEMLHNGNTSPRDKKPGEWALLAFIVYGIPGRAKHILVCADRARLCSGRGESGQLARGVNWQTWLIPLFSNGLQKRGSQVISDILENPSAWFCDLLENSRTVLRTHPPTGFAPPYIADVFQSRQR